MSRNTVNEEWTVRPHLNPQNLKSFQVSSVSIPYLSPFDTRCSQYTLEITSNRIEQIVGRGCPIKFFTILINSMMNIGATIRIDRFGNVNVVVNTFYHMKRHIDEAIKTMIDRSFFTDLSFDDARKIVSNLSLEKYLYCFEGHESGVCFVVLGPNDRAQNQYEQPWCLFKRAVEEFNKSRTIFMKPDQEKHFITDNEDFRTSVEFTSSFNKTTRQVVFKKKNSMFDIINQVLLVEKLEKEHSDAKRALEEMLQLKEILELQKRMFPLTQPQL
jgi:hypothetical protein